MSDQVYLALIGLASTIVGTYAAVRLKTSDKKKRRKTGDERWDDVLEGYKKLMDDQQKTIKSKTDLVDSLQETVDELRSTIKKLSGDLDTTTALLKSASEELKKSTRDNQELREQLERMGSGYTNPANK